MSQVDSADKKTETKIILPQENFRQCYTSGLELPISLTSSIALHALIFALLLLAPAIWFFSGGPQAIMPPELDVVEITGGGGTGGKGFGPGAGMAQLGGKEKIENIVDTKPQPDEKSPINPEQKLDVVKKKELEIPKIPDEPKVDEDNPFIEIQKKALAELNKAREQVAKAMNVSPQKLAATGTVNVGGSPGSGGGFGGGEGTGVGTGKGPGRGTDPKGRLLTKSEKRERRWLIDFSGSGVEHLKKLKALNITLALPSADPRVFRLVDLSGPQPRFKVDSLAGFQNKVKWFNQTKQSLSGLAQVLKLPLTPRYVVIFLPEEVEEEMAQLEVNFRGVPEDQINFTWFEIKLRDDGSYGPVVVAQR